MTLYSACITLLLVMDPWGNIPIFISVLKNIGQRRRKRIILREMCIALLILVAFLFWGDKLLQLLQISMPAISISGGLILFLISIKMIFPSENENTPVTKQMGEPFLVPLAIPLVAGPATMTMVMLLESQAPEKTWLWLLALLIAWFFCTIILLSGDFLQKILGQRGIIAMERLMGMILTTMSVQMFIGGIRAFFSVTQ